MPRNRRPSLGGQGKRGSGSKSRKKSRTRRRSSSIKKQSGKLLPNLLDSDSPTELTPLISGSPSQISTFSRSPSLSPSRRFSKGPARRPSLKPRRKSTDDGGGGILVNKKRRKSLAVTYAPFPLEESKPQEYLEGSDLDIRKRPRILQLQTKIRVGIWKLLNNYTLLILRQVCHRIKFDIDNFVGVHAVINQSHRSFGFFVRVGIRSAIVTNLTELPHAPLREILVYPDLLLELSIQGTVSNTYFAYLMENCRNLVHLEIDFSKRLLALLPDFFPTADVVNHLTQLKKLEITSETRHEYELKCVRVNLEGLFNVNLRDIIISNFHIHLVHTTPSPALRECHKIVSNFVNLCAHDLVTLAVTIKEKRGDKRTRSISDFDIVVNKFIPPPPETLNSLNDFRKPVTPEQEDQDDTAEAEPIDLDPLTPVVWRNFKILKELHLSINGIHAVAWKDMPLEMRNLHSLYLDIVAEEGNWYMYRTTVHNCASTLRKVYLMDVAREEFSHHEPDTSDHLINIDLGFFNACRNLKYLTIKCQETGSGAIYRMKSVSELPKSLTAIHFTWAMLTTFQMLRMLVSHRHLHSFQVEYWSSSLSSFRRFLCLLKYVYKFNLTKAPLVTIVDHKVRFQSGLNSVKNIIRSLAPTAHYIDEDQTLLEIDTSVLHKH